MAASRRQLDADRDVFIRAFDLLDQIEKEGEPFRFYYRGFSIWLAIRQSVYFLIVNHLDSSRSVDHGNLSKSKKIWVYLRLLLSRLRYANRSLVLNLKRLRGKYLLLSYEICRKTVREKEDINVFIDPLRMADARSETMGVEFITSPYYPKTRETFYTLKALDLYLVRATSFVLKPLIYQLCKKNICLDNRFRTALNAAGIGDDILAKLIAEFVSDFECVTRYWTFVFKRSNPKLVAVTDWYSVGNMLLVFVANQMGIPTVDMTHGLVNAYHFGYIFRYLPMDKRLGLSFPNYVMAYGQLQKDIMLREGTWWKEEQIKTLGSHWMDYFINAVRIDETKLRKKLNIMEHSAILLITSQEPVQPVLKEMLSRLEIPQDWHVVVKLHPHEVLSWRQVYGDLACKSRLTFLTDLDANLYELLRIARAHASFFSTVLWEAPMFGVANYIVDHSTKELVCELETLKIAKVSALQEIFKDNFLPSQDMRDYLFSNLDGSSASRILDFFRSSASARGR